MADFVSDFQIEGRGWVNITAEPGGASFVSKDIVVQNKSHNALLFWCGAAKPTVDSDGYYLAKMGDTQFATVITKLWAKGHSLHVSEVN